MALMAFVFSPAPRHLMPDSPVYWLLIQIGMVVGIFTAWPAYVWLINHGVKEAPPRLRLVRSVRGSTWPR